MKKSHLFQISLGVTIFLAVGLACAKTTPVPSASPTHNLSTAILSQPVNTPLPPSTDLWFFLRGGTKLDQGWSVADDPQGNIYFATYQQATGDLFPILLFTSLILSARSSGGLAGGPSTRKKHSSSRSAEIPYTWGAPRTPLPSI